MQAIQLFEYKYLQENLQKIQQEDLYDLPCEHSEMILQYQDKLKEIYEQYQLALEQVSAVIDMYNKQKLATRRLISHHRSCKKVLSKKKSLFQ